MYVNEIFTIFISISKSECKYSDWNIDRAPTRNIDFSSTKNIDSAPTRNIYSAMTRYISRVLNGNVDSV